MIFWQCQPNYIKENNLNDELAGKYCMVRTKNAGVFAGTVIKRDGSEIELSDARRIWYWAGAASLSQLAEDGTSKPRQCKFPCAVPIVVLLGVIEIIPISDRAALTIAQVPVWQE